jgi:hypothetical protein
MTGDQVKDREKKGIIVRSEGKWRLNENYLLLLLTR